MVAWYYLAGSSACVVICLVGWIWEMRNLHRASAYINLIEMEFRLMLQNNELFRLVEATRDELLEKMKEKYGQGTRD